MQITPNWSRSKSEVKFQYSGRLYFETGSSYISAAIWDISTKFGLLIDFDPEWHDNNGDEVKIETE